jgi:hypothetical protein
MYVIKGWNKFQHYHARNPPWIKLHNNLLDDYQFHALPVASRALAPMLWLMASDHENPRSGFISGPDERIAFRLRWSPVEFKEAIKPLIDHGFILLASIPLAPCKQDATPESENRVRDTITKKLAGGMGMPSEKTTPKREIVSSKNTELKLLPWTPNDKARLTKALTVACSLQQQYGKSAADLELLVEGFAWVLKPYAVERVLDGIEVFMRENFTIPTPYDIRQIIDPIPPKFKPNPAYYVKPQKIFEAEGAFGLNDDEIEYIRRYEGHLLEQARS